MCFLGTRLVKTLGSMLLMSYSGQGVSDESSSRVEQERVRKWDGLLKTDGRDWIYPNRIAFPIAFSMCFLGTRLVKTLGSMLLMSYSGQGVSDVIKDHQASP
jgi:hypothetical protein